MNTHAAPTTKVTIKEKAKYKFTDTKNIYEHLEYLGYTLEKLEDPNDDFSLAKSLAKPNVYVTINQHWVKLVVRYGSYEHTALEDIEFFKALNDINKQSRYSLWFVTVDHDDSVIVVSYAAYRGYEKISFGDFVTTYEQECATYAPTLSKWFMRAEDNRG